MYRRCLAVAVCLCLVFPGAAQLARAQDDDLDFLFEDEAPARSDAPEEEDADAPHDPPDETAGDDDLSTVPVAAEAPKELPRRRVIEEIVVTAQKREQRLIDVPINVSAMSGDDMRNVRVEQVRDVAGYIPNVDIKEQVPGAIPVITIRGIGLDDFSSTNSPAAGIYVDQVTLSSLALMSFDLFDMERIEVLKGPQGTLYGRNSTAGAINVLTARPAREREGFLKIGYGDFKAGDAEAMYNLPLGDTFAVRVAGKIIRQDEGFWNSRQPESGPENSTDPDAPIVRDLGTRDIQLARGRAGWQALDNLMIDLKVESLRQRSELGQPEHWGALCSMGSEPIDPDNCTDSTGYSDPDRQPYKGDWLGEFPYNIDQLANTMLIDWDLGWASVASVTGTIDMDRFFHIDVDAQPADLFNFLQADKVKQFSQELRLGGSRDVPGWLFGDSVDWLIGGFYSEDDVGIVTQGRHQDLIPGEESLILVDQKTRSGAGFVNLDWRLSELFTLVGGYRYSREARRCVCGTTWTVQIPGTIENTFIDETIRDTSGTWRFGLNFMPGDDSLFYASASKGVKSGGFFAGVTTQQRQVEPYLPEELIAYEVGAKLQGLLDGLLSLNASVFYYDYENVQTFMRDGSAPVQFIGNVPEARVYGADLDARWLPLDGLTLSGGVGWLRTRLGAFTGPDGTAIPEGNELGNAPALTLNALARYELPIFGSGFNSAFQADAHYSDSVFKEATNDPLIRAEPYWIYNARVALFPAAANWELALWGRNLTDETYVVQGLNVSVLFVGNRNYSAPRTAGIEFSYRF